jgi:hypothetical protein
MVAQYAWLPLEDCTQFMKEADLQKVFDDWGGSRAGRRVAGAPNWLLECKGPNKKKEFITKNYSAYSFRPDVLWDQPQAYVLELKRSAKYEPAALAEVLHHAWKLSDANSSWQGGPPVVPVMVSSSTDGAWQRGAINFLFAHGLRRDALRYLEVTFLKDPAGVEYLWIEEPFAAWDPACEAPNCVPASWHDLDAIWYQINQSESWILTDNPGGGQKAIIPDRFVFVSGVPGYQEYLACLRTPKRESIYVVRTVDGTTGVNPAAAPPCPFPTVGR